MILGMTLHPGEECTRKVEGTEHLIIAALDCRPGKYAEGSHLSSCLLIKHGGYEQVVCTLEKGILTQQKLDLVLLKNEVITFTVEGTGTIYITGYTTSNSITFEEDGSEIGTVEVAVTPEKHAAEFPGRVPLLDARPDDGGKAPPVGTPKGVTPAVPPPETQRDATLANLREDNVKPAVVGPSPDDHNEDAELPSESAPSVESEDDTQDITVHPVAVLDEDDSSSEDTPLQCLRETVLSLKKETFMESMMLVGNGQQLKLSPRDGGPGEKFEGASHQNRSRDGDPREKRKRSKQKKRRSPVKDRVLECAFCEKPFPTRYMLERHERIHTGDKPFSCKFCSKSYGDKSNMKYHIWSHHKNPRQRQPYEERKSSDHGNSQMMKKQSGGRLSVGGMKERLSLRQSFVKTKLEGKRGRGRPRKYPIKEGLVYHKSRQGGAGQIDTEKIDKVVGRSRERKSKNPRKIEAAGEGDVLNHGEGPIEATNESEGPTEAEQTGSPHKENVTDGEPRRKVGRPRKVKPLGEDFVAEVEIEERQVGEEQSAQDDDLEMMQSGDQELDQGETIPADDNEWTPEVGMVKGERGGRGRWACATCDKTFLSRSYLRAHRRTHALKKPQSGDQELDQEERIPADDNEWTPEGGEEGGIEEKPWSCSTCDETFVSRASLRDHRKTHALEKPLAGDQELDQEERIPADDNEPTPKEGGEGGMEEKQWSCSICDKTFVSQASLRDHGETHALVEKPQSGDQALDQEERILADDDEWTPEGGEEGGIEEKQWSCSICDKTFVSQASMRAHRKKHGQRPFQCADCEKSFTSGNHLKRHRFLHTGERPFECEGCGQRFSRADKMRDHKRRHHPLLV